MIFAKYLPHLYQGADHKGHRTYNMGGGGGGGPTQSTVTQSNIPEYLRPQVEALLGAGMQEYFDATPREVTDPNTGETRTEYDITGTKPYTPYSQNAADYFAPFSQQQQQVFGETAGMQTPGGFMAGQQMTGMAGQGGLDTVGSAYGYGAQGAGYGGQGSMFGQQAAGTGSMYERMATDPMSMQAYMSPYMQNVVEIQKQQAIEDAQRAQLGANLNAAKYGTYGGARQTLAQTQREAALNKQLSDIQAQGLQSAFDQAQKSQQFGVTSGLQGLQAGISGAQTGIQGAGMGLQGVQGAQAGFGLLGRMGEQAANIGTAQQQADIARLGFQRDIAGTQQQRQQDIINQQIQNFALAQEMPSQRLSAFNALLRGYALPTSTISQYQAAPNALQTLGAVGAAGSGIAALGNMGGKKAGGAIRLAKGGGITDTDAIESFAEDLSIPQLQQSMQSGQLKGKEYIGMPILQNKVAEAERMKMAQTMMGSEQQGQPQSISDVLMQRASTVNVAGGGMIAFETGGLVTPRILQDALNKVNAATNPQEKQAAQNAYNQLLKAYQTQTSSASDTGAGIGDVRPGGGIAPSTKPAPVIAAPVQPKPEPKSEPKPEPQGITSVAEPTLEQEMADYQKAMTAAKGEDTYGKFLEEQAKKNALTDTDYLLRAAQGFGAAGNILAGKDASKELGALAAQRATDVQAQQARAEAAAKRADMDRGERGEAFKTVYGKREERAKEKRAETRKKEEMEAEQKFKREISEMELKARAEIANKSSSSQVEYIGRLLESDDPKQRALGERLLPLIQGVTNANMSLRIQKQAISNVDGRPNALALKMTKPEEYQRLVAAEEQRIRASIGGQSANTGGDVDMNHPLLQG
jgi:hypothetical protein